MTYEVVDNIFCILAVAVLIMGMHFQKQYVNKSTKRMNLLLFSVLFFCVANIISEIFDGNPNDTILLYIVNEFTFFGTDMIMSAFAYYIMALVENTPRNKKCATTIFSLCALDVVITTVLTVSGLLFAIEDGLYIEREFIGIPYFISVLSMMVLVVLFCMNRKNFDAAKQLAIILYLVIPTTSIVLELYTGLYSLTPMSITISVIIVYILIQVTTIQESKEREDYLERISTTDVLTGLQNRRAYYTRLTELESVANMGAIFCDVNGLKYTNDHFGHAAGDELLVNFTKLLSESFRKNDIFRISGDEFVVLIANIAGKEFEARTDSLKKELVQNDNIAAMGSAYGAGRQSSLLVSKAEDKMYEDKKKLYKEKNIDR